VRIGGVILILALGLAGCGGAGARLGGTSTVSRDTTVISGGETIAIAAPPGFCVDETVSQTKSQPAFILLGSCRVIRSNAFASAPEVRALLTASISTPTIEGATVQDNAVGMDRFFRSDTGKTALSRSSEPETIEILDTFHDGSTYFLHASDSSEGVVPEAANEYWRAYFDLKGQLVALSVIGFVSRPLSPETGLETLQHFTDLMREKNGVPVPPRTIVTTRVTENVATNPDRTDGRVTTPTNGGLIGVGLFRRIFN